MACLHTRAKPSQDGNYICPDCGSSVGPGFRPPNRFVCAPATDLDLTAIAIGGGFSAALGAAFLVGGLGSFVGAVTLFGRLVARAAGF